MTRLSFRMTRRGLGLRVLGLGLGLAFAPPAFGAPALRFPLRLGYARVGPDGFMKLGTDDQAAWTALQTRLGGLIDEIEPIQPADMFGARAPDVDGGASCAMVARQIAANSGFSHVVLYATSDGRRDYPATDAWYSKAFASFRSEYFQYGVATGEAHLLDVAGGPAIASVSADAPAAGALDVFGRRRPERKALARVTAAMERKLQSIARVEYESQRSIAD